MGWASANDQIMGNNCYYDRMINQLDYHESFWSHSGRLTGFESEGAIFKQASDN